MSCLLYFLEDVKDIKFKVVRRQVSAICLMLKKYLKEIPIKFLPSDPFIIHFQDIAFHDLF